MDTKPEKDQIQPTEDLKLSSQRRKPCSLSTASYMSFAIPGYSEAKSMDGVVRLLDVPAAERPELKHNRLAGLCLHERLLGSHIGILGRAVGTLASRTPLPQPGASHDKGLEDLNPSIWILIGGFRPHPRPPSQPLPSR